MTARCFSHSIVVNRPADVAIHLFTPKGEEAWVPGWKPDYIAPSSGETREEMLFTTGEGAELTYWTCMAWRPEKGHARYFRLTPTSRVVFVDVRCRREGDACSRVAVSYEMHALTAAGESEMADMTQATYEQSIDEWAERINALDASAC